MCSCMRSLLIIKSNNYKLHTYIHFNYSIEVIRKKNTTTTTTLEEYFRIKVDIECVFLFLLNFKTNYISQTRIANHIIYKTTNPQCSTLTSKS